MTTVWTDEQRRAIELREGDLLLDASAGSGKTSVLVERFVRAVLEDGVDVAAILAITFTEKAAAELRDRIRARLLALGAGEQARATEGAFISTIHGFCARVLRANALTAGLDPAFVVLEREQSGQLATAAFDEALVDLERADPDAASLLADYGAGPLRAATLAVYGQLRSQGQAEPRLPPAPPPPGPGAASELEAAARAVAAELGEIAEPGPKVTEALGRLERCLELIEVPDLWPTELDRVRLPSNGSALSTDACGTYAEALGAYKAACAARAAGPVRDRLDALLTAFGRHYQQAKRVVSGLDFEDLELVTLELLRGDGGLRERYQQRFERIMVDELQDTNRVQLELIELISRGNLFTVGDAQQSIYRFRHADVELFERRGERLSESGQRATLRTNYRSAPEILDALNVAFGEALGEQFRPLVAGRMNENGKSSGEAPDAGAPRVELLLVDKGADWELEGLASPWRLAEARALAGRVAELVQGGTAPGEIVVLIRATTDMRAYERALEQRGLPTYVIGGRGYWLHPQVLDLVSYLRVLANPRDEEALYAVLASPLVGASLDALVVLAGDARGQGRDPWWLLSETGGRLEALDPADIELMARFVTWLSAERESAPRRGLEALIDAAMQQTGYDVAMLAMSGGRRRLANVRKLMRLAREYERDHGPDLHGFLALVAERAAGRGGDARESEAPVEGDGLDAIRLMTIHRAKGLEFHTVCVADLGRSPRPPYQMLRVDSDGRLGLRLARSGTGGRASALDYDAIGIDEKAADEREERRLFYVAMTRARERLILSGATRFEGWLEGRFTGGGPVAWIAPAFVPELGQRIAEGGGTVELGSARVRLAVAAPDSGAAGDKECAEALAPAPLAAGGPSAEALAPAPRAPAPHPDPPAAAPRAPASPVSSLSYSALGAYARCGYRFYAERVLGLPAASEPRLAAAAVSEPAAPPVREPNAGLATAARSATERGTLVHGLLERLNFRRPLPVSHEAVLAVAAHEGLAPPTTEETRELAELVARFAASELCARLGRATEVRREERFAFLLEGSVLVNGAIDVLAREPGGRALVVDYKSDRLEAADPAALVQSAYATQRLVYALAALRSGAERADVAYCFLEIPERPVVVTYERSQLEQLDRGLRGLADGVLRGEFPVTQTPHRAVCAGCPAEGGLCSWPLEMTRREAPDRLF